MFGFQKMRRLARDREGVTSIEFVIVAPVMILLLTGLLEYGYVLFARSTLESAVLDAARGSRVADCPNANAKAVEKLIQERMDGISSADGLPPVLIVESYGQSFGDVGNPEPFEDTNKNGKRDDGESYTDVNGNGMWDADMGQTGDFGDFGEVVRFTATFNVTSLVPLISTTINGGEDFHRIQSVTVVRNEPFQDTTCAIN